jgi:hypothetical protein
VDNSVFNEGERMRRLLILSSLTLLFVTPAVHAGFLGAEMSAVYNYPALGTSYGSASFSPSTFTVGGGVETTGEVEGITTLSVDFTDTRLTVTLHTDLGTLKWNPHGFGDPPLTFNGPVFTLVSPGTLGITGASVNGDTTLVDFDNSRVAFDSTHIMIDWAGLTYTDGQKVVVDFAFGNAVPEPSSVVALGAGCLLPVAVAIRRRRAA